MRKEHSQYFNVWAKGATWVCTRSWNGLACRLKCSLLCDPSLRLGKLNKKQGVVLVDIKRGEGRGGGGGSEGGDGKTLQNSKDSRTVGLSNSRTLVSQLSPH